MLCSKGTIVAMLQTNHTSQTDAGAEMLPAVSARNVSKYYGDVEALKDLSLEFPRGQLTSLLGPSGCGKTTLLNLISGILQPHSGTVTVDEVDVSSLSDAERRDFRIANVGFVFQQFELISYLNVAENIRLAYLINSSLVASSETSDRVQQLAEAVGIQDKLRRPVHQLSQGEQQRVAICRALLANPKLILADEPTGNLDPENKLRILDVLFDQVERGGQTLLAVTHDMAIVDRFDRKIDFRNFTQPVGSSN